MTRWKKPPVAKIYEAISAVADGRVRVTAPGAATVVSSAGDKSYDVTWSDDGATITSNDNASYWQGYAGYPIVAVLMTLGRLRVDDNIVPLLAGVDWHDLNERFRRDYDAAVAHVLAGLEGRGEDVAALTRAIDDVAAQLAVLGLERTGRGKRPPA